MNSAPGEFIRKILVNTLGAAPRTVTITPTPEEEQALARRFGWLGVSDFRAVADLWLRAGGVAARGTVSARVIQACVATARPVSEKISADFDLLFIADQTLAAESSEEGIELSSTDLDRVEFDGQAVDLGDAVAQTLALEVNPFPRSDEAAQILKAAGVQTDDEGAGHGGPLARALRNALNTAPPPKGH